MWAIQYRRPSVWECMCDINTNESKKCLNLNDDIWNIGIININNKCNIFFFFFGCFWGFRLWIRRQNWCYFSFIHSNLLLVQWNWMNGSDWMILSLQTKSRNFNNNQFGIYDDNYGRVSFRSKIIIGIYQRCNFDTISKRVSWTTQITGVMCLKALCSDHTDQNWQQEK